MIKSITAINCRGESIKLELTRPEKSGFLIKNISGLFKPPKATINTTKIATLDGERYNSSRLDKRDIQLVLEFMNKSTETIEDLRLKSYKYFPIGTNISLIVETDNRTVEVHGHIEDNDPQVFETREYTTITILCSDPYLYSLDETRTVFSGVNASFSFPFSNNSLDDQLLKMGSIENKTTCPIFYKGDLTVGMTIIIHAIGDVANLSIHNITANEEMRIDTDKLKALTGSGIISGDTITITTHKHEKKITLLRDGVKINILNCLDRGTKWLTLTKGDNLFGYKAESGTSNLQVRMLNKTVYEGV